ncbi:hypothetical protein J6590_064822 [Homalodisca vitripennis]|nr:hypothetical protein J6590_064822 [Homalodisca vitripennis]
MEGENVKKRGTIHSGERELIRNVIDRCDEESRNKRLSLPLNKAKLRAAKYCNVSEKTIKRIRSEGEQTPNVKLSTPGKRRKRPDYRNVTVDGFDRRVILDTVRDFYVNKKIVPSCKKLLPVLKEKINFQRGETSLRRVLKDMGFNSAFNSQVGQGSGGQDVGRQQYLSTKQSSYLGAKYSNMLPDEIKVHRNQRLRKTIYKWLLNHRFCSLEELESGNYEA